MRFHQILLWVISALRIELSELPYIFLVFLALRKVPLYVFYTCLAETHVLRIEKYCIEGENEGFTARRFPTTAQANESLAYSNLGRKH